MSDQEKIGPAIDAMRKGLDALAAWIAAHSELPVYQSQSSGASFYVRSYGLKVPHGDVVRAIADGARIGEVKKDESVGGEQLFVIRSFGGGVELRFHAARDEVCVRRVVGTETVQVPDPAAPLVEVEREIVEWDCQPILAAAVGS